MGERRYRPKRWLAHDADRSEARYGPVRTNANKICPAKAVRGGALQTEAMKMDFIWWMNTICSRLMLVSAALAIVYAVRVWKEGK